MTAEATAALDATPLEALRQRWSALQGQAEAENPERYRQLALYLQVLRDGLLGATRQACFHLATQVEPQRYAALPAPRRRRLHQRLDTLVRRTCSLLTVEQLCHLAAQMAEERRVLSRLQQQQLSQGLDGPSLDALPLTATGEGPDQAAELGAGPLEGGQLDFSAREPSAREPSAREPVALEPPGSVRLGLALPIGSPLLSASALEPLRPAEPQRPDELSAELSAESSEALAERLRELLVAAAPEGPSSLAPGRSGASAGGRRAPGRAHLHRGRPAGDPLWRSGRLPRDPLELLRWWVGIEQALARRLRNLSHALNVELLRQGLSSGLLPLSLLEAVLAGQIETPPAPPNLIRLPVPMAPGMGEPAGTAVSSGAHPGADLASPAGSLPVSLAPEADPLLLELQAVLLRVSDLEQQLPPLRTCRRRLQQVQQRLRTMADEARRLQQRLAILEAQQLWQQDISAATPPP